MDTDETASIRYDLNRYRNLLVTCTDEAACKVIRSLIAELEAELRELDSQMKQRSDRSAA